MSAQSQPVPSRTGKDLSHTWIGAAEVPLTAKVAKHAALRLSYRADAGDKIDVLEVYCRECKRPYDDVADQPCSAKIDNRHLIGGDQSVRAKRKIMPLPEGAVRVKGPSINRRGIDAVLSGEARG